MNIISLEKSMNSGEHKKKLSENPNEFFFLNTIKTDA